jgi:hypothetical protein
MTEQNFEEENVWEEGVDGVVQNKTNSLTFTIPPPPTLNIPISHPSLNPLHPIHYTLTPNPLLSLPHPTLKEILNGIHLSPLAPKTNGNFFDGFQKFKHTFEITLNELESLISVFEDIKSHADEFKYLCCSKYSSYSNRFKWSVKRCIIFIS